MAETLIGEAQFYTFKFIHYFRFAAVLSLLHPA
jgi:hypothetical protein